MLYLCGQAELFGNHTTQLLKRPCQFAPTVMVGDMVLEGQL